MFKKIFSSLFPKRKVPVVRKEIPVMYATINEVEQLTGERYSAQKLVQYCNEHELNIPTITRTKNNCVNSYPDIAWKEVHNVYLNQLKLI